ncbi:MAG TPA: hypothetical protein VF808_05550 [Ktedonobacterales bacterium]
MTSWARAVISRLAGLRGRTQPALSNPALAGAARIPGRRRLKVGVAIASALALLTALAIVGLLFVRPPRVHAAGQVGGCKAPNALGTILFSNDGLQASYTTTSNTATYMFTPNDESSSGGIPGLIEYCVYASSDPSSAVVSYPAWTAAIGSGVFAFSRPDGDPSNVPFDSSTQTIMGTATWSGGSVPADQVIVLHINDADECSALYGGSVSTCFVLPTSQTAADLKVVKTANPSYTRQYGWGISKKADPSRIAVAQGGSATFNYTVSVTHDSGTDSAWTVTGNIEVANPNSFDVASVNVTDSVNDGGICRITDINSGTNETVPADGTLILPYTCDYSSHPAYDQTATNTATATWPASYNTPDSSASGFATFQFVSTQPSTIVDGSVAVTDTLGGSLGSVSYTDPSPTNITYSYTFSGDPAGICTNHDNTASFSTNTTSTTGSDTKTVTVCVGADLTVSKTAATSFTRTYNWSISKAVDKTLVEQIGGTATFNYTVIAKETGYTDGAWQVNGVITVSNPNDWEAITANVTDAIDNGGVCTVTGGSGVSIPASSSVQLPYTCAYTSAPSPTSGVNTATATWDKASFATPDDSASGTAPYAFSDPTNRVNQTVTITDTFNGSTTTLGTLTASDTTPYASATYTYSHTVSVPVYNCVTYTNTAKIVETGQSDSKTIKVCGPAKTGALTMGFWQNKNGQGILSGGASTSGVCNSGTWLRQYAPFQDLSATATCSQVASYVYGVIKAANASGSSMNAMLKAQMLATALDVYFSDSALSGNKINAPAPIGGVTIDLAKICHMIDSSTGTATCSGSYENVSSAFGGASGLTVSQMLSYAASQSSVGGGTWYGNVKATQQYAKDAFDAINNQVAFGA